MAIFNSSSVVGSSSFDGIRLGAFNNEGEFVMGIKLGEISRNPRFAKLALPTEVVAFATTLLGVVVQYRRVVTKGGDVAYLAESQGDVLYSLAFLQGDLTDLLKQEFNLREMSLAELYDSAGVEGGGDTATDPLLALFPAK